jgi:hypothetical protein
MKKSTLTVLFTLAILAGLAAAPGAQQVGGDADPCRTENWDNDYEQHCEVRDSMLPAGPLSVEVG